MKKIFLQEYLPFLLISTSGAILRIWGISWGLPLKKAHIDESVVIFYSMKFFSGDFNPHIFFDYPTLCLYMLFVVFLIYYLIGLSIGIFNSLNDFVGQFLYGNATGIYISARLLSLLFALGSIYIIYRIGKKYFNSGLLPAALLSFTPLHILHSHYATVDIASIFFTLLSFGFLIRYISNNNKNDYLENTFFLKDKKSNNILPLILGSYILGLATAVKYYPAIFIFPLILSIFSSEGYTKGSIYISISILFISLGFITGCPYAIIDFSSFFSRFLDRFRLIVWHPQQSTNLIINLKNLSISFLDATSLEMTILILIGLISALILTNRQTKLFLLKCLLFPISYLLFLSTWKILAKHYIIPSLPFLYLIASYGLVLIIKRYKIIPVFLITILISISIFKSIKIDILLSKKDTRLIAYDWIKENIPIGSRILRLPFTPEFSNKDPFYVTVDWEGKKIDTDIKTIYQNYDYIITSRFTNQPPLDWELSLKRYYNILYEIAHIPLDRFHHPRITIYGKKT